MQKLSKAFWTSHRASCITCPQYWTVKCSCLFTYVTAHLDPVKHPVSLINIIVYIWLPGEQQTYFQSSFSFLSAGETRNLSRKKRMLSQASSTGFRQIKNSHIDDRVRIPYKTLILFEDQSTGDNLLFLTNWRSLLQTKVIVVCERIKNLKNFTCLRRIQSILRTRDNKQCCDLETCFQNGCMTGK